MKYFFLLLIPFLLLSSCKKDKILNDPNAKLAFSTDSVLFDTVFTHVGSVTKVFKVYNNESQPLNISNIRLAAGAASPFRLNVDGNSGVLLKDMEILAGDSLYAFVQVTVNPTNQNSPLLITDEVLFETNGNVQSVYLTAIGQDVYLHKPDHFPTNGLPPYSIIHCNESRDGAWKNDKPHLIFGLAVVDSGCRLTMLPGTKVYLHKNAILWVYAYGSLQIRGEHNNEVTFEGDRLEADYKEVPGQWGYIWLMNGSLNNNINWAKIKNGAIGVKVGDNSTYPQPSLTMTNTIIKNQKAAAIYSVGGHITSNNCVFANCGQYVAALTNGGAYHFEQCTFANYWDANPNNASNSSNASSRATPSIAINNFYKDANDVVHPNALVSAYFGNCIISGDLADELLFDSVATVPFHYTFDHCILKTALDISNPAHYLSGNMQNANPAFKDANTNNYNLSSTSQAINNGNTSINVPLDLNINMRDSYPDIGAYELIP